MVPIAYRVLVVLAFALAVSGCAAIEGIFKAGFFVGILVVVVVVGLLFMLMRGRS